MSEYIDKLLTLKFKLKPILSKTTAKTKLSHILGAKRMSCRISVHPPRNFSLKVSIPRTLTFKLLPTYIHFVFNGF